MAFFPLLLLVWFVVGRANPLKVSRKKEVREGSPNLVAENNSAGVERQKEPTTSIEYPVVRKKFRVTIDVEATLAAGPRGGALPPAPENVPYTRALMERLQAQPELVDRLLRSRAVDAAKQAGKALEVEHRERGASEQELLGQIIAELDPDTQAYFTEELEEGASGYYFDGYGATVERVSMAEISEEE
jgi:hypothetical protein